MANNYLESGLFAPPPGYVSPGETEFVEAIPGGMGIAEVAAAAEAQWGAEIAARDYALPIYSAGISLGGQAPGIVEKVAPVVTGAVAAAAGLPAWASALLAAIAGFGVAQLTGGEEEAVAGTTLVPFGGPGLAEPGKPYLLKEWHRTLMGVHCQFYLVESSRGTKRIYMYNTSTKRWKSWAMPKLAVIGKNLPSHRMLSRLRGNLRRHTKDARTILKLVSPHSLAAPKHHYHTRYRRARA